MKKYILVFFAGLLLLLLVVLATNAGLRGLIAGANWLLPVELRAEQTNGSLLGGLELQGLHYRDAALEADIDSIVFDWHPAALLRARVHVRTLHAEGIVVRVLQAPAKKDTETTSIKPLAFAIVLDELELADVRVHGHGTAEPLLVKRLRLSAEGDKAAVQVREFSLDAERYAARVQGTLSLDALQDGQLTTDWWLQLPDLPKLTGTGMLQGNARQLVLAQDISGPAEIALRATFKDVLERIGWDATLDVSGFNLQLLQPQGPERVVGAHLVASGGLEDFTAEGSAQLADPSFGVIDAAVQLARSPGRWQLQRLELHNPRLQGRLNIVGELADSGALTARAAWSELAWQLSQQQSLRSASGELALEGRLDDYRLTGKALLESTGYPALSLSAKGSGNLQGIELETLRGDSTQGAFDTRAALAWAPHLRWDLQADVRNFDPAFFLPERPGRVSFRLKSEGSRPEQGLQGRVSLDEVSGTLQEQPIGGRAQASFDHGSLNIKEAQLVLGEARLSANGRLDTDWNLRWEAIVPDLARLQPGTRGSVRGRGQLTGPRTAPRISAALEASELTVPDLRLRTLQANIDVDLADRLVSKIDLKGDGLEIRGQPAASLAVDAEGTLSRHVVRFSLQQDKQKMSGSLSAGLATATWSGVLEALRIEDRTLHTWSLQQPMAFTAARSRGAVKPLCLLQAEASLCAEADWQASGWSANLDGSNLPLTLLKPWLEQEVALDGRIGLQVRATQDGTGLRATGRLELAPGSVRLEDGEESLLLAQFGQSHLTARLQDNVLEAELELPLQDNGGIGGRLRLGNVASKAGWLSTRTTVDSELRLQFIDNGLVSAFVPGLGTTQGQVNGNLAIRGTLANPVFDGTATLDYAELTVSRPGLRLTNARLQLSGDGNTLAVQGTATSGEGVASVEGKAVLAQGALAEMDLAIRGENVLLLNTPEARLLATPDLKLALRGKRLDITGSVRVPEADIRLLGQKSVAKESGDLVIVQEDAEPLRAGRYQVYSRVTLELQDKVAFSGFGLDGMIRGTLEILEDPGKATRGRGELNIIDGKYALYGQKLDIETGRLVFAGGPIGNPGLEMRVTRTRGNVVAGVRVTGNAASPRLNLYSEPAMEQSEILSYLLFGVPTRQASGAQGAALTGAAASLGLTGGDLLARKLGGAFGIEEVRIDSGDSLEESSLVLGKYLSPRLYVGYAVGLFEQSNTFRMRYNLSRRWTVQTEAGVASGADLVYSLEND